jgi:hypothetical protein
MVSRGTKVKEFLNDAIKDASALIPFKYLHRGADFSIVKRAFPAALTMPRFDNRRQRGSHFFRRIDKCSSALIGRKPA